MTPTPEAPKLPPLPANEGLPVYSADQIHAYARDALAAQAELHAAEVKRLLDVATGRVRHDFLGLCPDSIEGPDSRDPQCPACKVLLLAALAQQETPRTDSLAHQPTEGGA